MTTAGMRVPYTLLLSFPEMYAAMHMQCTLLGRCRSYISSYDYCVESYFVIIIAMHAFYYRSMDGDGIIILSMQCVM